MKKRDTTFQDLFKVNIKYLEYLLEKSYLSHQQFHNVKLSGDQIEFEFRNLLSNILPNRYRVTHGYIAYARNTKEAPALSPQIDLIVVDTLVPHSIFIVDNTTEMEVVPVESVVAIFEVKRTMTPLVFKESLDYLFKIQKSIELNKANSRLYTPFSNKIGMLPNNPLIGILSLTHEKEEDVQNYQIKYGRILKEKIESEEMPDLDIMASLGNFIMVTENNNPKAENPIGIYTIREVNKIYKYYFKIDPNYKNQAYFLSITIGYILFYISNITGRLAKIDNYFFNETMWQKEKK